jgi:hypothetical protein
MPDITRNPLTWPQNVARTPPNKRARPQFGDHTISQALSFVLAEVNRLNVRHWDHRDESVIISTNLKLRQDNLPRGDQPQPPDTGAAVFFTLRFPDNGKWRERPCVVTCDKWARVEWNLWAIAKDIEAQRARARWGCGTLQQAFQGYLAIPERCSTRAWWDILKVPSSATIEQVKTAYKGLAMSGLHPDKGGSQDGWVEIKTAYDQAIGQLS